MRSSVIGDNNEFDSPVIFSASQYATSLGLRKRTVIAKLKGRSSATVIVRGQIAEGYTFQDLPENYKERLHERAEKQGFDEIEQYVQNTVCQWEPQVAISELHEDCIEFAQSLKKCFKDPLLLHAKRKISLAETIRRSREVYKGVFGDQKSAKTIERWIRRVLERDRGYHDFDRLVLYLPERLKRKFRSSPNNAKSSFAFPNLSNALESVDCPSKVTAAEVARIWDALAFDLRSLTELGQPEKAVRKVALDVLTKSEIKLSESTTALRRQFYRKIKVWSENGQSLKAVSDRRPTANRSRSLKLPEEDRLTLLHWCERYDGNISQAWRYCLEEDLLSYPMTQRYITNSDNRSYVPNAIREQIRYDVDILKIHKRGRHNAKKNGAYIRRDYSDITPMDWIQSDDVTLPAYYWERAENGPRALRGQCLLFCDVKSGFILGFSLLSERNYNARVIRETIVRIHDEFGLPRKGFYFESGIWTARLIQGKIEQGVPWEETEHGLSDYVSFRYTQPGNPRSKLIEGIIGILQNMMEPLQGYCGRNEMVDKFEDLQKNLARANSGKKEFSSFLLSKNDYSESLKSIIQRYNETPQSGRLNDRSPKEVFYSEFDESDPLVKLPKQVRYLLSNHRKVIKVSRNGVRMTFKGNSVYYRNHETGRLQGQKVAVWYNTEEEVPEFVTLTDLHNRNPVIVERETVIPSMNASREDFQRASQQVSDHNGYGKALYKTVKNHGRNFMFRDVRSIDRDSLELGEAIESSVERSRERKKQDSISRGRITRAEKRLGIAKEGVYEGNLDLGRKEKGLKLIESALEGKKRNI